MELPVQATFVIFSGLPGTGKSSLAKRLAGELSWPLLCIDDVAACMPAELDHNTYSFWDLAISALLRLAEVQLKLGVSVIADSIFMNLDRFHAREIARRNGARFLPVHTFVSNEVVWKERVIARFEDSNRAEGVAAWEDVLAERNGFRPWKAGTAMLADAVRPLEENYALVRACALELLPVELQPLSEVPFTAGRYHGL